jgi:hypothetical protein
MKQASVFDPVVLKGSADDGQAKRAASFLIIILAAVIVVISTYTLISPRLSNVDASARYFLAVNPEIRYAQAASAKTAGLAASSFLAANPETKYAKLDAAAMAESRARDFLAVNPETKYAASSSRAIKWWNGECFMDQRQEVR